MLDSQLAELESIIYVVSMNGVSRNRTSTTDSQGRDTDVIRIPQLYTYLMPEGVLKLCNANVIQLCEFSGNFLSTESICDSKVFES